MALVEPTGWSPRTEWIESVWHADPSILLDCPTLTAIEAQKAREGVPLAQHPDGCAHCGGVEGYFVDGRAEHLVVREGADPPTRIRFRALTARERSIVRDEVARTAPVQDEGETAVDYYQRCERHRMTSLGLHYYLAATVALDFPAWTVTRIEWHGLRVLPAELLTELGRRYGDAFVRLYGAWIWRASTATEGQKKTSSPTSTIAIPATTTAPAANGSPSGASASPAPTSDLSTSTA